MGASSRLRLLDLIPDLAAAGIAVTACPFFDDAYLRRLYAGQASSPLRLAGYYAARLRTLLRVGQTTPGWPGSPDLIWIEKEMLPYLPLALERRLLRRRPYLLDFDDAWHTRYAGHASPLVRRILADKLERLAAGAAAVTVGNDWLGQWAASAGARLVVKLPTPVDLRRYPDHPAPPVSAAAEFRLGWVGTPASARYLAALAAPLRRLAGEQALTLVTIAAHPAGLPGVPEEFHPWAESSEGPLLSGVHAVLMPVPDAPFERGKSGYKIIQAMAAGRPVVASPVGENRVLLADGGCGLLAEGPDAWVTALRRLRDDAGLRLRLGQEGRQRAASLFDRPRVATALAGVIRQAVASAPRSDNHRPVAD